MWQMQITLSSCLNRTYTYLFMTEDSEDAASYKYMSSDDLVL